MAWEPPLYLGSALSVGVCSVLLLLIFCRLNPYGSLHITKFRLLVSSAVM